MMTDLLFFAFYFILCLLILYILSSRSPSFALTFKQAALIFSIKVFTGCVYGYFFLHYYNGDDTWFFHAESLKEYALLKTDPLAFITQDIFKNGYTSNQFFTIFDSHNSFSKDLQDTLLIKLLAVFDVFSGGRYYVNVIFYNLFVFWGSYYLFLVVGKRYPEKMSVWFLLIFFFPPLLFWTSGIRKDGLSFALLCGFICQMNALLNLSDKAKHFIFAMLIWITLFLSRSFIGMSLIPVTIAWIWAKAVKRSALAIYILASLIFTALFFATNFLSPSFNLPAKVAERQASFLNLSGGSYLPIDKLDGTFGSYLKILPEALNHIFVRPYPWEAVNLLYFFSFAEIAFFFAMLIWAIVKPSRNYKKFFNDPFILSLIMLAFINYLIIGYTVPFMGAFIRYRSIFEIFFLIAVVNFIGYDFGFIKRIIAPKQIQSVKEPKLKRATSIPVE